MAARRVYTSAPRAAMAWTVIRGASTPSLRIAADKDVLKGDQENKLTLTLSADEYVAAGTRLHIDCREAGDSSGCNDVRIETMNVSREDGVSVDLSDELGLPVSAARSAAALEIGRTSNCEEWTFCKLAATRLLLYAPKHNS